MHDNTDTEVMARFLEEYRGESAQRISDRLLNTYAVVGLSDHFEASAHSFLRALGVVDLKANARENVTADKPATIADSLRQVIIERNARDVAIFDTVAPVIEKRLLSLHATEDPPAR